MFIFRHYSRHWWALVWLRKFIAHENYNPFTLLGIAPYTLSLSWLNIAHTVIKPRFVPRAWREWWQSGARSRPNSWRRWQRSKSNRVASKWPSFWNHNPDAICLFLCALCNDKHDGSRNCWAYKSNKRTASIVYSFYAKKIIWVILNFFPVFSSLFSE